MFFGGVCQRSDPVRYGVPVTRSSTRRLTLIGSIQVALSREWHPVAGHVRFVMKMPVAFCRLRCVSGTEGLRMKFRWPVLALFTLILLALPGCASSRYGRYGNNRGYGAYNPGYGTYNPRYGNVPYYGSNGRYSQQERRYERERRKEWRRQERREQWRDRRDRQDWRRDRRY